MYLQFDLKELKTTKLYNTSKLSHKGFFKLKTKIHISIYTQKKHLTFFLPLQTITILLYFITFIKNKSLIMLLSFSLSSLQQRSRKNTISVFRDTLKFDFSFFFNCLSSCSKHKKEHQQFIIFNLILLQRCIRNH